jgi:hypothetical protein
MYHEAGGWSWKLFNKAGSWDIDGKIVKYEWDFNGDLITDVGGQVAIYSQFPAGLNDEVALFESITIAV